MRRALRENAICALLALAGCLATAWLTLYGPGWNDYETEARPAFEALTHGHLAAFLRLAPVYGGSLVERAPFAALAGLSGGGGLAVYRAVALPCMLAAALLAVWLNARMRAAGRPLADRCIVVALCVANPVTLTALELGHPEELLGGALCVIAVLLASAPSVSLRRALATGLVTGLAIANKEWALLALGPVLLALPSDRRFACLAAALASAGAVLAPLLLGSQGSFAAGTKAIASPGSTIFQPWQLFWFLGHHGALVHGAYGAAKPGYRIGPSWAGTLSHPLILAVGVAFAAVLWAEVRPGRLAARRALLALALVLLARCLLDTWDALYYPLPFLLALLAWEATGEARRPPLLTLIASSLVWLSFHWLPERASPDVQAACFLAWSVPLAGWLTIKLLARPRGQQDIAAGAAPAAQPMTVSALGRPVSTSAPVGLTTARSSIRTPSIPGR